MKKKNAKKLLILLYFLVLAILVVVIYFVPKLTGMLTRTEILEYGNLQMTDEAVCYIGRTETVYLAGTSGNINYYVPQDTPVRKGGRILEIVHENRQSEDDKYAAIVGSLGESAVHTDSYAAEFSGIVSYYVDGYEALFSPVSIAEIDYEKIEKLYIDEVNLTREYAYKGEPVYKICDDNQWYLTCWLDAGETTKYQVGNQVIIQLPLAEITATVDAITDEGEKWQIIFKTNRYYKEFAMVRKVNANIIAQDRSGIIIPNKSITTNDGVVGVYIKTKSGEAVFRPIKVLTSDGTFSIAEPKEFYDSETEKMIKTVDVYDELIKNPN